MYLIDTSVWIDYFRQKENEAVHFFKSLLDKNIPCGLTDIIFQEILQGAATTKDFETLSTFLATQHFFHFDDVLQSHKEAAWIYFRCKRKGVTIRSTIDCVIAQVAIEHNLTLVHNDSDFIKINGVFPDLKLYT